MSTALTTKPSSSNVTTIGFPQTRNFFEELEDLNRQIAQRAFNLFQQGGGWHGRDLGDWFQAESELLKPVPIEVSESGDTYTIRAEVPGFDAKALTVRAEPNAVCIHGKKEQKKEEKKGKEVTYSEVSASTLCRRVELDGSINPDKVSAHLANGVLELTVPKASPAKPVEVKVA
jgi:HSP20 family protein